MRISQNASHSPSLLRTVVSHGLRPSRRSYDYLFLTPQATILVLTALWQVRHLKGFFEAKKLV